MDVRCERCGTEYEFDDALVSDRGTSVKCTECGNEFRVVPRGGLTETGRPDAWHVRRVDGSEVTYTSLRELQRAIRTKEIKRDDRLRREGQTTSRALGTIPELEDLLRGSWQDSTRAPILKSTVDTLRPQPGQSSPAPTMEPLPPPARAPIIPARVDTLRPSAAGLPPAPESDPATLQRFAVGDIPAYAASEVARDRERDREEQSEMSSPLPPLAKYDPRASLPSIPDDEPIASGMGSARGAPISFDHPGTGGRRRRVGGWIVSLVLLGGVAVLGFAVARPYLVTKDKRTAAPLDARAADLLSAADKAYAAGNLDLAKEDVDKASALAEGDPAVLLERAKVADARADVPWLRMRLLPPDAVDEIRTTQVGLTELSATADALAAAAKNASPANPAAVRAQIDALRLVGKTADARALMTQLAVRDDHTATSTASSDPETAYVLAALDAAEPLPPWRTVIERLRTAASAEGELGRARALLAYALARSGDPASARAEVDKMVLFSRPHPLTSLLRAFVQRQQSTNDGGVPLGGAPIAAVDVNSLPRSSLPGAAGAVGAGVASGGAGGAGDSRVLDAQGDAAREKGDYVKAAALYSQAIERSPNDSEALGGLGDVARARGDFEGAKTSYRRALLANPQYLPAMIGLADVEHDSGDKAAAQQTYKDIVDRFPDGAYPARVKERAEGTADKKAAAAAAAAATAASSSATAPASSAGAAGAPVAPGAPSAPTAPTAPAASAGTAPSMEEEVTP